MAVKETTGEWLRGILGDGKDYVSHVAALYFQGYLEERPDVVTVVSSGRRRPRQGAEFRLAFVFHPRNRPALTRIAVLDGRKVRLATVEQALIDLVTDTSHSLLLEPLGDLFARLPFRIPALIEQAGRIGNSALKRVLFWLLWCGRAGLDDLPALNRTPVRLRPELPPGDLLFESHLQVTYPAALLECAPATKGLQVPSAVARWLELRRYASFCRYQREMGWLAVRDDTRKRSLDLLEAFFRREAARLLDQAAPALLASLVAGRSGSEELPGHFQDWLTRHPEAIAAHVDGIQDWMRSAFGGQDLAALEIAIRLAPRMELVDEAVAAAVASDRELFQAGGGAGVEALYDWLKRRRRPIPLRLRILAARVLARENRCEKALSVIEGAGRGGSPSDQAEILFVGGIVLRQMSRFADALERFNHALDLFTAAGAEEKVRAVEIALGNVHFSRGHLPPARKAYLRAAGLLDARRPTSVSATLFTNLGLVEFKAGRFVRARKYLRHAAQMYHGLKNPHGEGIALLTLGKTFLAVGNADAALRLFRKAETRLTTLQDRSGTLEARTLQAWAHELAGKGGLAGILWKDLEAVPDGEFTRGGRFLYRFYLAMKAMLDGDFREAETRWADLAAFGKQHRMPEDEIAYADFHRGLSQALLKREEASATLREALTGLSRVGAHCLVFQAESVAALLFPGDFPNVDLQVSLHSLLASEFHDPFWYLLAPRLWKADLPVARKYVRVSWQRSPADFRKAMADRIAAFRSLNQALNRRRREQVCGGLWRDGARVPMTAQDYETWKAATFSGFRFDSVAGTIGFRNRQTAVRIGSHPHTLLTQLLFAYPQAVSVPDLFQVVWGCEYDAECDWPALKIALIRLQKALQGVAAPVTVVRERDQRGRHTLRLDIFGAFEWVG